MGKLRVCLAFRPLSLVSSSKPVNLSTRKDSTHGHFCRAPDLLNRSLRVKYMGRRSERTDCMIEMPDLLEPQPCKLLTPEFGSVPASELKKDVCIMDAPAQDFQNV